MLRICRNVDCMKSFTVFQKYAISSKPSKQFFCMECRKRPQTVFLECAGCHERFQPTKLSQIYCKLTCKFRVANRRAYNRNRYRRLTQIRCKFCNIIIPIKEDGSRVCRNKICLKCEEGFINRFNSMKCMLCGKDVKSKMFCSQKCRAYSQLILSRNEKNDGVL